MKEAIEQIHLAGGIAIIAHPGKVFSTLSEEEFRLKLYDLVEEGVDGLECYYSSHSQMQRKICLENCEQYKLLITSGFDCHGDFQEHKIGQLKTLKEEVYLGLF